MSDGGESHEACEFCPENAYAASLHNVLRERGFYSRPSATPGARVVLDRTGRVVGQMTADEAWRWVYASCEMSGSVAVIPPPVARWSWSVRNEAREDVAHGTSTTADGAHLAAHEALSHMREMGYAGDLTKEVWQ